MDFLYFVIGLVLVSLLLNYWDKQDWNDRDD